MGIWDFRNDPGLVPARPAREPRTLPGWPAVDRGRRPGWGSENVTVLAKALRVGPFPLRSLRRHLSASERVRDVDESTRGPAQPDVRGEQLGAEDLGERDVAGVVGRAAVSKFPGPTS